MGRNIKVSKDFIMFAVGALLGSAATWLYLKPKYEKQIKEDVESVKESFGRLYNKKEYLEENAAKSDSYTPSKEDLDILKKTIETNGYKDYSKKEEEESMPDEPYIISPNEYDELGYNTKSLTYWSDGIVTDNYGNVIDDYEDHIGSDALNHFGEYEDDSVYVRNDLEQTDYEILLDERRYDDVYKS